jgi:hypothetical protein
MRPELMRIAVTGLVLVTLVLLSARVSANAESAPSKTIDRTFRCSTSAQAGVRKITTFARVGLSESERPKRWKFLAHTWLHTGTNFEGAFAGVGAGSPQPRDSSAGLWIETRRCKPFRGRIPLTTNGLVTRQVTLLGDGFECLAPAHVVVRIRAELRSVTTLHRLRFGQLGTGAPVREAVLAARTERGKPLALAAVFESGNAQLFTARSCVED